MQEFNIEAFTDFIRRVLFEDMTVDDYILVIDSLADTSPKNKYGKFISFKTLCHNIDLTDCGYNLALNTSNMVFTCYSNCGSFDLLELVKKRFELIGEPKSRYKCMEWICEVCDIEFDFNSTKKEREIVYDWKKDLSKYIKKNKVNSNELEKENIVNDSILNYFKPIYHESWIRDNIKIESMEKYQIGYYPYRDCATIPCRNVDGELIGIRGRFFNPNEEHKYYPLRMLDGTQLNFKTNNHFYGLNKTKDGIKKHKKVLIVESEKGVLQSDSYYGEENFTVGNYGKSFSKTKRNLILGLDVLEVIIGIDFDYKNVWEYDEDEELVHTEKFEEFEKDVMRIANYFKGYVKVSSLISYKGHKEKDCALDNGKEWYEKLFSEREVIYE